MLAPVFGIRRGKKKRAFWLLALRLGGVNHFAIGVGHRGNLGESLNGHGPCGVDGRSGVFKGGGVIVKLECEHCLDFLSSFLV